MSRCLLALCAFVLLATPFLATASQPTEFQPPDAFRYAINAVIGDASYVERYGELPQPGTDANVRVHTHLSFVHALLSARDDSHMSAELRDARREHLARLREYIDAGVFPRNERYQDQTRPCFIDHEGHICAVGYLVEQSAGREAAERINASFQYAFISQMRSRELDDWIASSGFSRLELAMIQPCYDPEFAITITRVSELTVNVRGLVYDQCDCGVKYTMFDFGDAMWRSTKARYGTSVNILHTYSSPGAYVITGTAISRDWCGNEVESQTWIVNVGATAIRLQAVEVPGGPPYGLYLTTPDEVRTECLTSSLVQWQADEPPRPTSWYWEGDVYRTPVRQYASSGVRTITIVNNYAANCSENQTGSIKVDVNGIALATRTSTWGQIKALYR
ncbi:MAG TPA: hypothetical protein VFU38_05840 [Candidatus Krumholzibacteria bacterium]|nr:hypothetical protein [Candidatus Krumholzibacteria bacterium]